MPTADLHQELRQAQAELDQLLRAELDLQRKEKELRVHVIDLHARMRQDHTQDANDLVSVQTLRDTFPRPAKWILRWSLGGSTAPSLFRMAPQDRIKYKQDYEAFKLTMTLVSLAISLSNFLIFDSVIVDKFHQFVSLYYYATITLREHILWVNGSRILLWWFWHHYLSIALTGILLIWPVTTESKYMQFRWNYVTYTLFLSFIQWLQYQYQMSRLYTLRALSKAHVMDTTTETVLPVRKGLLVSSILFLAPFLVFAQLVQVWNGWILFQMLCDVKWSVNLLQPGREEPHMLISACLFALLGLGNLLATLWVLVRKYRLTGTSKHIKHT